MPVLLIALLLLATPASAEPLSVVTTMTDLGDLSRQIGGSEVDVVSLANGKQDLHVITPRPSYLRQIASADALVLIGMEQEDAWLPPLLERARNARVRSGAPGHVDASVVITPLGVPAAGTTRAAGDLHGGGNPHYLLDPLNGLLVAALLRDRFAALRPEEAAGFQLRYQKFRERLAEALVGRPLASRYEVEKLARLHAHGRLTAFLESQGESSLLGGWLGELAPDWGTRAVDDHPLWPYFAKRFGIVLMGSLEPKPGVPPTMRHLNELISIMKAEDVRVVLASAYYDPRHARFVAERSAVPLALMAHQVGARPGTQGYLELVDYNVRALRGALDR